MDLIDSAIYLKEKGLTDRLGLLGLTESGSLTALSTVFHEPFLFEVASVHVSFTFLTNCL